MAENKKGKALKEVWVLTCAPEGLRCSDRVFADLGPEEITKAAEEIASSCNGFHKVISDYVEGCIREELERGETDIRIDPGDETGYFILVKMAIDTGTDIDGDECYEKPPRNKTKAVYRGSKIYSYLGWYGDIECLYSTNWRDDMDELDVE